MQFHQVDVEEEVMDSMLDGVVRQAILVDDGHPMESYDVLVIRDKARQMIRRPTERFYCFFEELKVTIQIGEEFVPFLWTDKEVVDLGMMQGFQNGEMLKEKFVEYGRHVVLRW